MYASIKHEVRLSEGGPRAGFFLGDGAGVGKGRQIAGLVYQHYRSGGRRVLWVSVSSDLKFDAERDLKDLKLTPKIEVYPKNAGNLPGGSLEKLAEEGVMFCTYSLLIHGSGKVANMAGKGCVTDHGSLFKSGSRLKQLIDWLAKDPHGPLVVFDECHKAKNLINESGQPTKTGLAVVALQDALPEARVLYCSATGASEPKNLAYMTRLGNFGFESFETLLDTLTSTGMGALEMFAMGLKATGSYLCRTLSYTGAEFELESCPLSDEMTMMYDRSSEFWQMLLEVFRLVEGIRSGDGKVHKNYATKWAQFWGAHQRFFRQMLISAKVPSLAKLTMEMVYKKNMAVVIGLQSTGEANISQAMAEMASAGEDVDDFVSAPAVILRNLILRQFPVTASQTQVSEKRELWEALYVNVYELVRRWKQLPTVATTIAANTDTQSAAMERARQRRAASGAASGSSKSEGGDDDGEMDLIALMMLEEAERQRVKLTEMTKHRLNLTKLESKEISETIRILVEEREAALALEQRIADDAKSEDRKLGLRERELVASIVPASPKEKPRAKGSADDSPTSSSFDLHVVGRAVRKDFGGDSGVLDGQVTSFADGVCHVRYEDGESEDLGQDQLREVLVPVAGEEVAEDPKVGTTGGDSLRSDDDDTFHIVSEREQRERKDALKSRRDKCDKPAKRARGENYMDVKSVEDVNTEKSLVPAASVFDSRVEPNIWDLLPPSCLNDFDLEEAENSGELREDSTDNTTDSDGDISDNTNQKRGRERHKGSRVYGKEDHRKDGTAAEATPGTVSDYEMVRNPYLVRMRDLLLEAVDALQLPPNPLDHLVDLCGGPDKVAEMTGRKVHLVRDALTGQVSGQIRQASAETSQKMMNMKERQLFQSGEKLIAIISEAASTGISLQADKRVKNQRRRCHMTLELPWSAEKAIQQFGRSHRSNQSSAPNYRILVTACGGERRFASAAAKRLHSLGALLKGDRRALGAGVDLKAFDIDTAYGSRALNRMYSDLRGNTDPVPNAQVSGGDFKRFASFATNALASVGIGAVQEGSTAWNLPKKFEGNVAVFLNRILGLPVAQQALLIAYFEDMHEMELVEAKSRGVFDDGVVSLVAESITVPPNTAVPTGGQNPCVVHRDPASGAVTELCQISIDRGLSWNGALAKLSEFEKLSQASRHDVSPENGFWISTYQKKAAGTDKPWILCATEVWKTHQMGQRVFRTRRPYNSDSPNITRNSLLNNYRKLTDEELAPGGYAEEVWNFWYEHGLENCVHGAKCRSKMAGRKCNVGKRRSTEMLLTGALLPVWQVVSQVLKRHGGCGGKDGRALRVVRCKTDDGKNLVGLHIRPEIVGVLKETLMAM